MEEILEDLTDSVTDLIDEVEDLGDCDNGDDDNDHDYPRWNASVEYKAGDIVMQGNVLYIAIVDNISFNPNNNPSVWSVYNLPVVYNAELVETRQPKKTLTEKLKSKLK